jgi:hypothetical protein
VVDDVQGLSNQQDTVRNILFIIHDFRLLLRC